MNKLKAFTLVEVLITLIITGVVAVITLQPLIVHHQKNTYIAALRKFCNTFTQSMLMYQNEVGAETIGDAIQSQDDIYTFVNKSFKIVQSCSSTSYTDCFADSYKRIFGANFDMSSSYLSFVLSDGTIMRLQYHDRPYLLIEMAVDINGKKGPNILGRDLFKIALYKNGKLDDMYTWNGNAPLTRSQREKCFSTYTVQGTNNSGWGFGYFAKILNDNWEMNY